MNAPARSTFDGTRYGAKTLRRRKGVLDNVLLYVYERAVYVSEQLSEGFCRLL
jgi:hypothetical protein